MTNPPFSRYVQNARIYIYIYIYTVTVCFLSIPSFFIFYFFLFSVSFGLYLDPTVQLLFEGRP
jgi:hypothetical protein